ncbi:uncharacterized protein LOC143284182 [Babylonia areolata]|uniref:uncharacterized protein LOC143284182 n=1 Tax=Babylonia areolata TaxID=304850 RepID=UPI003FD0FE92
MNDVHAAKDDGKGHRMTLTRKLLLCAQLGGTEAIINFQQIYTVPILQTLGMPLSLTYLPGLVSGPSSILLLPFLGWLLDRGHNPQRRKFASIVFAAGVQTLGMLCLLLANAMHLGYLMDYSGAAVRMETGGSGSPSNHSVSSHSSASNLSVSEFVKMNASGGQDVNSFVFADDPEGANSFTVNGSSLQAYDTGSVNVPLKAGLGMLGVILMDLGFDCSNCFVKAFLVTCSARAEHTSLLVVGVVVGAVGGVTNAALGLVDFTSLLGLDGVEGARLTIQTSAQGLLIILVIVLGLVITFITGHKQLRQLHQNESGRSSVNLHENRSGTDCAGKPRDNRKNGTLSTKRCETNTTSFHDRFSSTPESVQTGNRPAVENSIRSSERGSLYVDPSVIMEEEIYPSSLAEDRRPLLKDDNVDDEEEEMEGDWAMTASVGYGATDCATRRQGVKVPAETGREDAGSLRSEEGSRVWQGRLSCVQRPKARIALMCVVTFFTADCVLKYAAALSDFVGKGVYGGSPVSEPGSDSLNRYQEGMKTASRALMLYFATYLVSSILHPRLLACLGFRAEFLLLQSLMAATMLVTALTSRLEAVFLLCVVSGVQRTCFYTMPYAVTNDIAQSIDIKGEGRNPVALALSLVAASMPLSYCLLFSWAGAVEELTGDVSAPLWMGSASGALGIVAFLFVGKV